MARIIGALLRSIKSEAPMDSLSRDEWLGVAGSVAILTACVVWLLLRKAGKKREEGRLFFLAALASVGVAVAMLSEDLSGSPVPNEGPYAKSPKLADKGYLNSRGKPFNPKSVLTMVRQPLPKGLATVDENETS